MNNRILMNLLKVLNLLLAILLGWGFWLYLNEGVIIVLPFLVGYIFILIGLIKSRKWAWIIFLLNFVLSILFWAVVMIALGLKFDSKMYFDYLLAIFAWISAISMIVGTIFWFIRKLTKEADKWATKTKSQ